MDAQGTLTAEKGSFAPVKNIWRRFCNFIGEIWNDHDFWIRALAIKGGASAIVVAGVVGVSYVVALPFLVATVGIIACSCLIGLGLGGVFLGLARARDKLVDIYFKTLSRKPAKEKTNSIERLRQKLLGSPRIKKLLEKPLTRKLLDSQVWKTARALAQKQQDVFLASLAGTGSVFWGSISALALVTQIVVLPVVAVGSLFTVGTVLAVGGLISGAYGIYLSAQSLIYHLRAKKKRADDKAKIKAPPNPALSQQPALTTELTPSFTPAAEKAEKTEKPPVKPAPPPPAP